MPDTNVRQVVLVLSERCAEDVRDVLHKIAHPWNPGDALRGDIVTRISTVVTEIDSQLTGDAPAKAEPTGDTATRVAQAMAKAAAEAVGA